MGMGTSKIMESGTIVKELSDGIILQSYTIDKMIGEGGSGFTYDAFDNIGKKKVIIKEYVPHNERYYFARDKKNGKLVFNDGLEKTLKEDIQRKIRNIAEYEYNMTRKAMITQDGNNSPYVFEFSWFEDEESDIVYGVVQTCEGETFSQWSKNKNADLSSKLEILLEIGNAIGYIHSRGIFHADITPDNLYISGKSVHIIDFGTSIDLGEFYICSDEEQNKFINKLYNTNVGSVSTYFCSNSMYEFSKLMSFPNKKSGDIEIIRRMIRDKVIGYADDAYSYKQIILFSLIHSTETKILSGELTINEYVNSVLENEYKMSSSIFPDVNFPFGMKEFMIKLLYADEHALSINMIQEVVNAITYNKFESHWSNLLNLNEYYGALCELGPNKWFDKLLKEGILNCIMYIRFTSMFDLLRLYVSVTKRVLHVLGAPLWFLNNLELENILNLSSLSDEFRDCFGSIPRYCVPEINSFFGEYYLYERSTDEDSKRTEIVSGIMKALYTWYVDIWNANCHNFEMIPEIKDMVEKVLEAGKFGYEEIQYGEIWVTSNPSMGDLALRKFCLSKILDNHRQNTGILCSNVFSGYDKKYKKNIKSCIIKTVCLSHEIDKIIRTIENNRITYVIRYEEDFDNAIKRLPIKYDCQDWRFVNDNIFPKLEEGDNDSKLSFIIVGIPYDKQIGEIETKIAKIEKTYGYVQRFYLCSEKVEEEKNKDNIIVRLLATLRYGGISKNLLKKLDIIGCPSEADAMKYIYRSTDKIFSRQDWLYLIHEECCSCKEKVNQSILLKLLEIFLLETPKASYYANLFLSGLLSSLDVNCLGIIKRIDNESVRIFSLLIQYVKNAECVWLRDSLFEYCSQFMLASKIEEIFYIEEIGCYILDVFEPHVRAKCEESVNGQSYQLYFQGNKKVLTDYRGDIDKVFMGNIVSMIGHYALSNCNIKSLNIPNLISDVGSINNKCVEQIVLPEGMISVSSGMFMNCFNLREIKLPDSVQYIGKVIFRGCKSLRRIKIPKHIKYIDKDAFLGCCTAVKIEWQDGISFYDWKGELINSISDFRSSYKFEE